VNCHAITSLRYVYLFSKGLITSFQFGAVYLAHVPIIRARDYHFLNEPHCVDIIAAGWFAMLLHVMIPY